MCGIVGYIGSREITSVLLDGLKRLEYRGYDSCGVAIMADGKPNVIRSAGRIAALEQKIKGARSMESVRDMRHRAHSLGDARPAERNEFASASRLHQPFLRRAQRNH